MYRNRNRDNPTAIMTPQSHRKYRSAESQLQRRKFASEYANIAKDFRKMLINRNHEHLTREKNKYRKI